jgi:hypothetical protein
MRGAYVAVGEFKFLNGLDWANVFRPRTEARLKGNAFRKFGVR